MEQIEKKRVDLQDVVNYIHDAAMDPDAWPEALTQAGAYCGASFGGLIWMDVKLRQSMIAHASVPDDAVKEYSSNYFLYDPANRFQLACPAETVSMTEDWEPRDRYLNSKLYQKLFKEFGVEDRAAVVALRDASHFVSFGIGRDRYSDPFTRFDLSRLKDVSPHLRRAIQITHRLRRLESRGDTLMAVLDRIDDAVFLLDGNRRTVFNNPAAERLVAEGVMTVRGGRLQLLNVLDSLALEELLRRVTTTGEGAGTDAGDSMTLHSTNGEVIATLTASPLRTEHVGGRFGAKPVRAFVCVRKVGGLAPPAQAILRSRFRLTHAEMHVALGLAKGLRLKEIAEDHGLGKETVRSQLRSIFDKTGVRRQGDLIKVLLTLSGTSQQAIVQN